MIDETILPDDNTTLFVCSGMQRIRDRFSRPDGSRYGSVQSCLRTNDLELVGDGTHLTYFEMIGSFSFGCDYREAVELWHAILGDLEIPVDPIHCHPDQDRHCQIWKGLGYEVVDDPDCVWSDGQIGGYCCEVYSRGIEIGNLVHTLGQSSDVGFGRERLALITEGEVQIDRTSLFRKSHPVVADHSRALEILWKNGIKPGAKHRDYVCRRLLRRMLPFVVPGETFVFDEWLHSERVVNCSRRILENLEDYTLQ